MEKKRKRMGLWVLACLLFAVVAAYGREIRFQEARARDAWGTICVGLSFYTEAEMVLPDVENFVFEPQVDNLAVKQQYFWDTTSTFGVQGSFLPETVYRLRIKGGVSNINGDSTDGDVVLSFRTPRLSPAVDWLTSGTVIPLGRKEPKMPISVLNLDHVDVTLCKVHANNLRFLGCSIWSLEDVAEPIVTKSASVTVPDNKKQECYLALDDLVSSDKAGIYLLRMQWKREKKKRSTYRYYDRESSQLLIVTDLGIASCYSRESGDMFVSVRRMSDNAAIPDADVKVFGRHNQVIANGKTDKNGVAMLKCHIPEKREAVRVYQAEKIMVTAGDDCNFMMLDNSSELCVGEYLPEGKGGCKNKDIDAFVYAERGVARPGETIALSAFVMKRGKASLSPMESFPCVLTVRNALGTEICKKKVVTGKSGHLSHRLKLEEHCGTGNYAVTLRSDEGNQELGRMMFLVSTYVPDNVKLNLALNVEEAGCSANITATASAEYYFGAAADDLPLSAVFRFNAVKEDPKWGDYTVGNWEEVGVWEKQSYDFETIGRERTIDMHYQAGEHPYGPMKMTCTATVTEKGGRTTTRRASAVLHPSDWYLGLKYSWNNPGALPYRLFPAMNGKTVPVGKTKAVLSLKSVKWDYNLVKKDNGRYRYEWEKIVEPFGKDLDVVLEGAEGEIGLPELPGGCYEAVVSVGDDIQTHLSFWHCGGEGGRRSADPKSLVFKTDKSLYQPGDVATLTLEADEAGSAAVAFGECTLEGGHGQDVKVGVNRLNIQIPKDIQTESYYYAVTLVSGRDGMKRCFGLGMLKIDQSARRLAVKLDAPEIVCPKASADIKVRLTDAEGKGMAGTVHVFLVDEGILALTGFETPNIFKYFRGTRALGMEFHDIYSEIFPEAKLDGALKIGGDDDVAETVRMGSLAGIQSAVVVLDAVQTDADGQAAFTVKAPDHLGAMRVMCVAASDGRFGSGERQMLVRDKVGALASGPRVAAPGDEFAMTYVLNNFDCDGTEDYVFDVAVPEGASIQGDSHFTGKLAKGGRKAVAVRVKVGEVVGALDVSHRLSMGAATVEGTCGVTIRSCSLPVTETERIVLEPGASREISTVSGDWLPGAVNRRVYVGKAALSGCEESLSWLNSYPYGCLEQTTACAFPFLFMPQMRQCGLITEEEENTYKGRLTESVSTLMTMYVREGDKEGRFTMWPGQRGGMAGYDANRFATHYLFLLNRQIPQNDTVLGELEQYLCGEAEKAEERRAVRGYCSYVLSLRYRAVQDKMTVAEAVAKNLLATPENDLGAFLASAALVNCGFASQAMPRFKACLEAKVWYAQDGISVFSDDVSRVGMLLTIVMETLPNDASVHEMASWLRTQLRTDGSGFGTTQANAWAVAGLATYGAVYKGDENVGTATLNGGKAVQLPKHDAWKCKLAEKDVVKIVNGGKSPMLLTVETSGLKKGSMKNVSGIVSVNRTYLDKDGKAVRQAMHGELLTVKLTLKSACAVSNMVVVDMLPGGLEIEDGNLDARDNGDRRDDKVEGLQVSRCEKRDDRFLLFADKENDGEVVFTYHVRAVTRGTYQLPPTTVEGMYNPDLRAVSVEQGAFVVE